MIFVDLDCDIGFNIGVLEVFYQPLMNCRNGACRIQCFMVANHVTLLIILFLLYMPQAKMGYLVMHKFCLLAHTSKRCLWIVIRESLGRNMPNKFTPTLNLWVYHCKRKVITMPSPSNFMFEAFEILNIIIINSISIY